MTSGFRNKGLRWHAPFVIGADLLGRLFMPRRPHVLIACMPKSGSTFLAHILAAHSGLRRVRLTPAWGSREQELCEIRLSRYNHYAYVSQHHIKYSGWTRHLTDRYRMTTVVLVRDLFDIVVSMRDHIRKEGPVWSMAAFTQRHVALPDDELEAAVVDLAVPWFIAFYVGWRKAPDALWLDYAELVTDPATAMRAVLEKAGVPFTDASIKAALEKGSGQENRMNKGVAGRGMGIRP